MLDLCWRPVALAALVLFGGFVTQATRAADDPIEKPAEKPTDKPAAMLHDLRYKFKPGEFIRWKVEHRATIRTTIGGTTQTAETESHSVKVWRVMKVGTPGNVQFEHSVESILMKQRLTGRQEEVYDSTKDKEPPVGFQEVAKSVGVPLSQVAMDPFGRIIERKDRTPTSGAGESQIALPLPPKPVEIGYTWSIPQDVEVKLEGGAVKKIQTRQQFKLEDVKNGIATIAIDIAILTPVRDPAIEAQLIQRASSGQVKFDIDAGRIVSHQTDLDKQVFGFSGETSTMHYSMRFAETLLPPNQTAAKPKVAGPELPVRK